MMYLRCCKITIINHTLVSSNKKGIYSAKCLLKTLILSQRITEFYLLICLVLQKSITKFAK